MVSAAQPAGDGVLALVSAAELDGSELFRFLSLHFVAFPPEYRTHRSNRHHSCFASGEQLREPRNSP